MGDAALGFIETKGLVAAIEAADTMLKTANVVLLGKEITGGALVTMTISGDTAAVRSAVDAGAAAAQRVGELVSRHIIPRPGEGLEDLISTKRRQTHTGLESGEGDEHSPEGTMETLPEKEEPFGQKNAAPDEGNRETGEEPVYEEAFPMPEGLSPQMQAYFKELDVLTVHELRRRARASEGLSIHGRQISRANKKELMEELLNAQKF
ncbi:MAG: BMC domain-containing protein [Ignavibacteriae bacterium]|nr:MAG: BMC domain-containing protein [Ignavibacteriota bacterium]